MIDRVGFLIVCKIEFDVWETLKLYRRSSSSFFVSHIEFSVEFSQFSGLFRLIDCEILLISPIFCMHFLSVCLVYVWTILSLKLRDLWRWMSVYVWDDEFFISCEFKPKKNIKKILIKYRDLLRVDFVCTMVISEYVF